MFAARHGQQVPSHQQVDECTNESLVRAVEDMAPRLLSVSHEIHAPYRPKRGHRENRHGRRQASPLREQLGDEGRVGATLAVAHPESSTASFPSYEVASHALVASRTDPNEAIGKTGMGDGAPYGRDSVGDGAPYGRDSVAPTISRSQEH